MTQNQINTLNMFTAVLQYLDDNATAWNTNTIVTSAITNFRDAKNAIDAKAVAQKESDQAGYTGKKNLDFENMTQLAYKMAVRVKNYAVNITDPVLEQGMDISRHALEHGKEKDIVNRCTMIADKADSVVATAPAEYNITSSGIAALRAAIALIEPDTAERDVVSSSHTGTTSSLVTLFTQARTKLHIVDDLMEGLSDDDEEEFVNGYFMVRRTNDHHGSSKTKAENTQVAQPAN